MTVIVKGIETVDEKGAPYTRKDIDEWYIEQAQGERIQLSLFMEALALIQGRELTNLLSFFRLAAIHSAPWCQWDDVPQPPEDPDRIPGYCVHNDYTFPTWHRVYMMLYERTLYEAMYEWINLNVPVDAQDTWKNEADKWRLPFWDFARLGCQLPDLPEPKDNIPTDGLSGQLRVPFLCMVPKVGVRVFPKGKNSAVEDSTVEPKPNPLYQYTATSLMGDLPDPFTITGEFQAEDTDKHIPAFTYPWDKCQSTTKYGIRDGYDSSTWVDGGQSWCQSNYALNEHAYYHDIGNEGTTPTIPDLVNRLFQYGLDSWGAFSSSRYPSKQQGRGSQKEAEGRRGSDVLGSEVKNAVNLEFIHNNLHNFVGGTQFLRPDDDHMKLWGAGHMSSVHMAAFDPIFWIYHNNIDRLTAIWQSLNWDKWFDDKHSQPVRDNELKPFHDTERTFWKSDGVREWQKLGYEYGILKGRGHGDAGRKPILDDIHRLYGSPTQNLFDGLPKGPSNEHDDYVITVIYDKFALNGAAYKINLFLGDAEGEDDGKFRGPESEGFVASIYNFSGSLSSGPCGNCEKQKAEGAKCIAQVPATAPMRRYLAKYKMGPSEALLPVYVPWDNVGNSVKMDITVQLHRSSRSYFKYPLMPSPDDPLEYKFVNHGRQSRLAGAY
ncbi:unnamed protein product [Penicillium olsonii]|nr:unnamed protein product [Penicillium olsonii]CAG7925725.1 unnamed protein product [Penicillium olsonii]